MAYATHHDRRRNGGPTGEHWPLYPTYPTLATTVRVPPYDPVGTFPTATLTGLPVGLADYVPADYGVSAGASINAAQQCRTCVPPSGGHGKTSKRRCTKCGTYFTEEENAEGACQYHPGRFKAPDVMMPSTALCRWSCCKSLEQDEPGCRKHRHTADTATAAILSRFDSSSVLREGLESIPLVDVDDSKERDAQAEAHLLQGLQRMNLIAPSTTTPTHEETRGDDSMVRHPVSKTDTLVGIALRYGAKVDDIKRVNNLTSQSIFPYKYLLVPNPARVPSPEELNSLVPRDGKKTTALDRFRKMTNCSKQEAQYYMEENDFDIKKAVAAFQADVEWEKNAPDPRKVTSVVKCAK